MQPSILESSAISNIQSNSVTRAKDFNIKTKTRKSNTNFKHIKRETAIGRNLKSIKRPSTKEAVDRNANMTQISETRSDSLNQFNTAYPIRTPVQASTKQAEADSELVYGLSKTNGSFKKAQWMSGKFAPFIFIGSKAQSSTIGFSSSTGNTTGYCKSLADAQFRGSKYAPSGDQSTITRSSFYK